MKAGDILLVKTKYEPISWIIRKVTKSNYNHVCIAFNNKLLINIRAKGIEITPLKKYKNNLIYEYKLTTAYDISTLVNQGSFRTNATQDALGLPANNNSSGGQTGIHFKPDGSKMFYASRYRIYSYSVPTGTASTATTATRITVADESVDPSCFVVFVPTATGNQLPKTGTNLTFNSSTGALTATSFVGSLTGNADTATSATTATTATTPAFEASLRATGRSSISSR